ncbi:methyl-accepting chemotaxis protein [Domibacillus mangrovi]|uniref:Chemotaxis protein n=1 Tax=Domibacillus mangrovi TaxID=1714354 RepID=A0A1Q5P180_9BACI|nr:methyl-accepting chemotaxis protein [Domibacillus mangrovi]OKL36014.1 hypothetical protein BLL40_11825 [Domibacillus mangrovi]
MVLKIRHKLIMICMILLIIPSSLIGFISYHLQQGPIEDLASARLISNVEMAMAMIDMQQEKVNKGVISLEDAQEEVKTALLGKLQKGGTRPINKHIDLGENGYFMVLDSDGTALAHPYLEGENLIETKDPNGVALIAEMIKSGKGGGGFTYYDWQLPDDENKIETKVMYSQSEADWGWTVSAGSYLNEYTGSTDKAIYTIAAMLAGFIVIGTMMIMVVSKKLSAPIVEVTKQAKQVAEGNLRVEPILVKTKDEVGELTNSFNEMTANLHSAIRTVSDSAQDLASISDDMAASSQEVMAGVNSVSESTIFLAADAETGNQSAVEASQVLLELSSLIQIAKDKANSAEVNSDKTVEAAMEGKQTVFDTISRMGDIREKTIETEEMIANLNQYSKEIGLITDTITEIAGQTNLLALNAAIEAARAGEAGKGFAVVAQEVRKLAEQSNERANEVYDLVKKVSNSTEKAVNATQQSRAEVEKGAISVTRAGEALEHILQAVDHMVNDVKEINKITDSEVATSEKIIGLIHSLSTVIEQTASSAEELSAAMQQSSTSMEMITAGSGETSEMANKLKETATQFKV